MKRIIGRLILALLALVLIVGHADAQRRGGGGRRGGGVRGGGGGFRGGGFRSSARASVTRPANRAVVASRPGNVINNRPINNRPIYNRDVNVIAGGRWDSDYDGCCYYGPRVGAAAAVGYAAGAVAASSVGSVVYDTPSSCTTTTVNGVTYQQCGDIWYKPQFSGTSTSYVVTNPP
jgi:hypothetical protein